MLATIVVLWVGKAVGVITFPDFDRTIPRKVMVAFPNFVLNGILNCMYEYSTSYHRCML